MLKKKCLKYVPQRCFLYDKKLLKKKRFKTFELTWELCGIGQ